MSSSRPFSLVVGRSVSVVSVSLTLVGSCYLMRTGKQVVDNEYNLEVPISRYVLIGLVELEIVLLSDKGFR